MDCLRKRRIPRARPLSRAPTPPPVLPQADRLDDSRDVFSFLEQNGIGTMHALFYLARAIVAEQQGDYSLAASCYETALKRRAEPREAVEKKQYHFLRRMRSMWREYCADRSTRGGAALTDAETAAALANSLARGTADDSAGEDGTSRVALNRLGQWRARQEATARRATAYQQASQQSGRAVTFRSGAASGRAPRSTSNLGAGANAGGGAGFVIHDDTQRGGGGGGGDGTAHGGAGWSDFGTRVRRRATPATPCMALPLFPPHCAVLSRQRNRSKENEQLPSEWRGQGDHARAHPGAEPLERTAARAVAGPGVRHRSAPPAAPVPIFEDETAGTSSATRMPAAQAPALRERAPFGATPMEALASDPLAVR